MASGVPSSCAAAAARPSICERCCARARTSSVAVRALAVCRASCRHPIGIERHEGGADSSAAQSRKNIHRRKSKAFAADPRQRQARAQERGRANERQAEQAKRMPQRQRRRGDGHRRQQQNDERIGDAAGEKKEPRELEDIVAEKDRRAAFAQLQADGEAPAKREVERRRRRRPAPKQARIGNRGRIRRRRSGSPPTVRRLQASAAR